ncbi:DNA polymerase III subunit delta' [Rhodobacteraceae bacterium F11138]|nr:DNA polymerase III subunit delta' [Rhodobacteraceae bacterium F11138]
MSTEHPAPDQAPGAPHPRTTQQIFGQDAAQAAFLQSYASDRLHHGWLLTGPRGVGKATLAWHIARFLLATPPAAGDGLFGADAPPETLAIDPDHPVARRILAGADPGLATITRSVNERTDRMRDEIVVDDIRSLNRFFGLSAADGGRRVVIVDCADEMNVSAANALLKMLEEPPARTTLLLISHRPSHLLPTIRSRCRTLRLEPLGSADMQSALAQTGAALPEGPAQSEHLAALAAGSVGDALRLVNQGGLQIYGELIGILDTLPRLDRSRALSLAQTAAQKGASEKFELLLNLIDILLVRLARTGATGAPPLPQAGPNESPVLARLAATPPMGRAWADIAATITTRTRHGKAVNLDPASLVLDTVFKMQETAAGQARLSPRP